MKRLIVWSVATIIAMVVKNYIEDALLEGPGDFRSRKELKKANKNLETLAERHGASPREIKRANDV